jgi:hypothetical protein
LSETYLLKPTFAFRLPNSKQNDFAAKLHAAFVDGQVMLVTQQPSSDGVTFAPLAVDAPASQRNLLVLYSSGMVALRSDVRLPLLPVSHPFRAAADDLLDRRFRSTSR